MKRKRFTLHFIRPKLVVEDVTIAGYLKNNGRKNRAFKKWAGKKLNTCLYCNGF